MSSEHLTPLLTTDLLHLQAESRLRTHICLKSPQTCEGPGQQLLKPGSESVGVQIMNCGAVLDAVTCRCPQAVYNNKHKAARTTSFTASTKPSRCHRHNQNQDLRSEEHQVEQSVILPDTGDSTMFPDLWTSSNLLKMTLSLHREQEQTVTSRRCCDTNGPAQQNRIISDSTESR